MVFIYVLICPETNNIVYVGQTKNLKKRLYKHINIKNNDISIRGNWIRDIKQKGLKPFIKEVETCTIDLADNKEKYWIEYYINQGYKLLNSTDGGKSKWGATAELKEYYSVKQQGKNNTFYKKSHSEATKEKMRNKIRKTSKRCSIDNLIFDTVLQASKALNIHRNTLDSRLISNNFPTYYFL